MTKAKYIRGPKRKIEKRYNQADSPITVSTTYNTQDIWACTEDETLTRIVGNLSVAPVSANGSAKFAIVLRRAGLAVLTTIRTDLTGRKAEVLLWVGTVTFKAGQLTCIQMDIDVRGQRKLEATDDIVIAYHSDANSVAEFTWAFNIFSKKA